MIASASRWLRSILMGLVRAYKAVVSPWLPPSCRFVPSCSDYALEALQRKPLLVGLGLIVWRLCRCHPLCRGGFDPVPGSPEEAGETAGRPSVSARRVPELAAAGRIGDLSGDHEAVVEH
jgi:putative membrane protein insertion efficiency factor